MLVTLIAYLPDLAACVMATPTSTPRPELKLLYQSNLTLGETTYFGLGPQGNRLSVPITGGWFKGPRLSGMLSSEKCP